VQLPTGCREIPARPHFDAAACAGNFCAKAKPKHSGVVLAAASAATKKPALAFLIPRPQKPTFRQQRRTVGRHNPQSPKDHEITPEF
jgi:hypothetical protein